MIFISDILYLMFLKYWYSDLSIVTDQITGKIIIIRHFLPWAVLLSPHIRLLIFVRTGSLAMPLRDILHRKEDSNNNNRLSVDDFRFVRTDTHTEEPINLPDFIDDPKSSIPHSHEGRKSIFRRLSRSSDAPSSPPSREKDRSERRLSHLLHHDRSSSRRSNNSSTSFNLPSDLPAIESNNVDEQEREAQWEKRATTLIQNNPRLATSSSSLDKPGSSRPGSSFDIPRGSEGNRSRSPSISNPQEDVRASSSFLSPVFDLRITFLPFWRQA